jgi:hypothetical protein
VIVRDSTGNFIRDAKGDIVAIPQLARSVSNMPGYLSNGNTPEGLYKMAGTAVSKSMFIGPSPNIQMRLPFEDSTVSFFNDTNNISNPIELYKKHLPLSWQNYFPILGSFYAGLAGRTEIISHGTAVDPAWYKGNIFYPWTPTQGCLCTKELWDQKTGKLIFSDQGKLIDMITRAGGATGYVLVIDIDDKKEAVKLEDILKYLR